MNKPEIDIDSDKYPTEEYLKDEQIYVLGSEFGVSWTEEQS